MKIAILFLINILILNINLFAIDPFSIYVTELNNPSPGYLAMDCYQPGNLSLIDNSGLQVNIKNFNTLFPIKNIQLQPNGLLTFFSGQKFYVLDTSLAVIDSFKCERNYVTDYHEFILLSNGHAILLGQDTRIIDMSEVIEGGKKNATVVGNVIQELDENKNVVFEWNTFDHFKISDHIDSLDLKGYGFDLSHSNSIAFDLDSNLLLSSRFLDEITKIDRKTGEIIWRLGGSKCKNNQFRFINDTIWGFFGFSHQHSVSRLPNGNLLLFDNGNSRQFPFSRAVEYQLNEIDKTATRVWQYRPFPDTYSIAMGNVQRLTNGNTVIGWGSNSRRLTMTELHPDNSKAMEIYNFTSYRVKRLLCNMATKTIQIDKPDLFDFNDRSNQTGLFIDVQSINDSGYVSVERHYYKPNNINLFESADKDIYPNRWVVNNYNITAFEGIIKFDLSKNIKVNPTETIIYARPSEGIGTFYPLDTKYDSVSNSLEAEISGFGEFILCMKPKVGTPMLVYPLNNSKNIETNLTFSWIPVIDANKYEFQLSKDVNFNDNISDTSNIESYNIIFNNLEYETQYYWRVKAVIDTIESQWSEVRSFTTMQRLELEYPALISPEINSSEVPVTGLLKWNSVAGAKYYNIEVSLNADFQSPILERFFLRTPNLYYNNLDNNSVYYWHVSAQNDVTTSPWSVIWNFTTEVLTSVNNQDENIQIKIVSGVDNSLSMRIKLDNSNKVSLIIYNYLGNKTASIDNKFLDSGEQLIHIDSEQFLSGVYFYKLIIGAEIQQGKFNYIR